MNETIFGKSIGFAITTSFCTFETILQPLKAIVEQGGKVTPIMSFNASSINTKYTGAQEFKDKLNEITGNEIIDSLVKAEPIGPLALFGIIIVAPCTGNTLAKLACGITDTPVTMACKA